MRVLSVLVVVALAIASTANANASDKAPVLRGLQTASSDALPERNLQQGFISYDNLQKPRSARRECKPELRCRGRD
jgi:hypothetical protein